jgi:hypothetical protein
MQRRGKSKRREKRDDETNGNNGTNGKRTAILNVARDAVSFFLLHSSFFFLKRRNVSGETMKKEE